MNLDDYQEKAMKTDQIPVVEGMDLLVPLLGLAGEAGSLLTEYKKLLRDGEAHKLFKEVISEELGDLLWYVANLATKFDLSLEAVAEQNLLKCQERWSWKQLPENRGSSPLFFDNDFPDSERIPRKFEVEFVEEADESLARIQAFIQGEKVGDYLTDNSYVADGYRFHDVFHLAFAAVLGWSPVTRQLLGGRKRKSDVKVDEVEDGGRAKAIEEGISALIFSYGKDHSFLEGVHTIDYELLRTIKSMTCHLEVSRCSAGDWEEAILAGFHVWRKLQEYGGGKIEIDLEKRSISYQELIKSSFEIPVDNLYANRSCD
ncbi:MAG: nucleoside triphosphate pyrophosphohydrolase family protein [Cyanobacteria bacterium P01_D01_bin.56]